jgi:hypothetical protein
MSSSIVDLSTSEQNQPVLRELIRTLRGIRYGSVVLTVHDGRIVEIHRTERIRLARSKDP